MNELRKPREELIQAQLELAPDDARMLAQEPFHRRHRASAALDVRDPVQRKQLYGCLQQDVLRGARLVRFERGARPAAQGLEPGPCQPDPASDTFLQRLQVLLEARSSPLRVELVQQGRAQTLGPRTAGKTHFLSSELLHKIGPGLPHLRGRRVEALLLTKAPDGRPKLPRELAHRRRMLKHLAQLAKAPRPPSPCFLGNLSNALRGQRPEQHGHGPRVRREPQQARAVVQVQQAFENPRRVGVVKPPLVALIKARRGLLAHQLKEPLLGTLSIPQALQRQPIAMGLRVEQDRRRQVFPAIDVGRLRHEMLVPVVPGGFEVAIGNRLPEVGSGQRQLHVIPGSEQGELERLLVDREAMLAELDDRLALLEQLKLVAQAARGVLALRFQTRAQPFRPRGVTEVLQPLGEFLELQHHRIGREVGVELVGCRKALGAPLDPHEDAIGGRKKVLGTSLAFVEQLLLLLLQRLIDLLALAGQVRQEFIELAEARLQFLQLHHQTRQLLIATLGRIRQAHGAGHALRKQRKLSCKLRLALYAQQLFLAILEGRAHPVELREHLGNVLQDGGPLDGIFDLQATDHLAEDRQALGGFLEPLSKGCKLMGLVGALDPLKQFLDLLAQGRERLALQQESRGGTTQAIKGLDDLLLQFIQAARVNVAYLLERDEMAPLGPKPRQPTHELLHRPEHIRAAAIEQIDLCPLGIGERGLRLLFEGGDLDELVHDELCGRAQFLERGAQIADLGFLEPVVGIERAPDGGYQVLVDLP